MALKQYSVSLQCCYTVGAFPIRQLYCINIRNNYFFVFYYQFGVNVFCHDDFEFINFNVILIVPKKLFPVTQIL